MLSNTGTAISPISMSLSPEEWQIITELLDRERVNLPIEMHHTRTAKFRGELKKRLDIIDALLRRLHAD